MLKCIQGLAAMAILVASVQEVAAVTPQKSTMQPFAPGDVFVGATALNNPDDDHAGAGRIIQYDADLNEKGVLWVDGTTHLVSGLTFAPDGDLWAFDSWAWTTVRVAPNGKQQPNRQFAARPLSGVYFGPDSELYFTEMLAGNNQPLPLTTRHRHLPGQPDKLGDGGIYRYSADGKLEQSYQPEVHGGMSGSMAVTHATLSADGRSLIYVSETGPRLMHYDLVNARQLPDLQSFPDGQGQMYFDLTGLGDGRVLVSRGSRLDILNEKGEELGQIPLEGFGWSVVAAVPGGDIAYVANWFSGEVVKLDLQSGDISARVTIAPKCIAGMAVNPVVSR